MARLSSIVKNERRIKLVGKHLSLRRELRKTIKNVNLPSDERVEAMRKIQSLPRNSSAVRVRNRCQLTGRARGYLSNFKLSRITFRELALKGMIPGIKKSSW